MDELTVKHYDQAVGQFEQFVKTFADQQHSGAAIASRHDLRVNLRDRGEIEPEAGIGGDPRQRASRLAEVCPHALIITRSDGGSDEFHSFNSVSKRRQVRAGRISGAD